VSLLQKENEDDEHKGFFMSLYKDFKSLPEENKLEAKMTLMQAMYSVKYRPVVPHAQVPASTLMSPSSSAGVSSDWTFVTISPSKLLELSNLSHGQQQ